MSFALPYGPVNDGAPRQVAYLTNLYPSPSHSFIRREILGLEAAGWRVHRFAHRRSHVALVDPADAAELDRTSVLLDQPIRILALAVLVWLVERPIDAAAAFLLAMRMAWRGDRRYAAHAAYFVMACALSRRLRDLGCRHLHAHFGTNPAAVACLAGRVCGLSYSITFHGPHEFDANLRLNLRDKIVAAAFVITVSRGGHRRVMEQFPELASRFRLVKCGLDSAWFDAPLSKAQRSVEMLCVARLDPQKDPMLLLEAVQILAERGVVFHLNIAGDGMLRAKMEERIAASRLGTHVTLLGWQAQWQIIDCLGTARALVLSSHDEGLPVAIMEAFALGVPAIAPDVGGVSELVETGTTGWLVTRGDATALAEAMHECLRTSPAELRRMGAEGRRRVLAHDNHVSVGVLSREFLDVVR